MKNILSLLQKKWKNFSELAFNIDNKNILIFGSTGAIVSALVKKYPDLEWSVFAISGPRNII
jgi:FlaA1/EpsC-like NDP-sugar epimerase